MEYLLFALCVLLIAAFVYQSWQATKERQQLALLIKSRDVQEFVRASTQLEASVVPKDEDDADDGATDFDDLPPDEAARAISGGASTPAA